MKNNFERRIKLWHGKIIYSIVILSIIFTSCSTSRSIGAATPSDISNAIDSNKWTFVPSQVLPQYGRSRQVSGTYFVTQLNNQLNVYLPYFGKAYSGADVLSGKNPLDFTTVNFNLDKSQVKKGAWNISQVPRDNTQVQSMNFIFYDNGNASLSVTLTNRSGISYEGNISKAK